MDNTASSPTVSRPSVARPASLLRLLLVINKTGAEKRVSTNRGDGGTEGGRGGGRNGRSGPEGGKNGGREMGG